VINKKKLLTIFLFFSLFFVALKTNPVLAEDGEFEDRAADQYTLLPLMVNGGSKSYDSLAQNLIWDQGYEVHCAHKTWRIKKSVWGDIEAYFSGESPDPTPPVIFGGTDPYIGDFSKARIPMMRGMENSLTTIKNSSFEGMFGANYQLEGENYETNSSGVAQNLLSNYQQCVAKIQNVDAAVKVCDTIKATTDYPCTLNKEYNLLANPEKGLSAMSFNTRDVQAFFKKLHPELEGDERNLQVCADITSNYEVAAQELDLETLNKTQAAITAIPIDLDNLYRMAFLVLVPTQDPMDSEDKFHFLQSNANINAKKHAPVILAFKIPDFATNKSLAAGNVDSLELTKMVLQTNDQNNTDLGMQADKRETLLELTKAAKNIPEDEKTIQCEGFPQCKRSNDNLITNIIIDMINAKPPFCEAESLLIPDLSSEDASESAATESVAGQIFNQEDIHWEKAGDLFTPASKDLKSYDYQIAINDYFVNQLFSTTEENFNWQLEVDKNPPETGDEIVVNGYLVLPVGETVKDANKSLAVFWNESSFVRMIAENNLVDMDDKTGAFPKFLTIKNENTGFKAGGSHDFCMDYGYVEKVIDGETVSVWDCIDKRKFGVNVGDTKKDLLFPDFGLGWMVRKIQQTIRDSMNDTYDYIKSCERVEDMFLGRCSGKDKDDDVPATCDGEAFAKITGMPSYGGVSTYAKEYFDAYIKEKITTENMAAYAAAEEATGIPCEIAAAIHINEGGMNADQSLFDGGALRGTLEEDAVAAMHHLLDKITALGGDVNNLEYKLLVEAIGNYNGPGNQNCSDSGTRWSQGGKCPPQFTNEDHGYVLAFLDDRHSDMDGLFCIDFVKFDCTTTATQTALDAIKARIKEFRPNYTEAQLQEQADKADQLCFSDGQVCTDFSNGNKFPARTGPGAIPNAIMIHELGN
jgi:hypothetical protein